MSLSVLCQCIVLLGTNVASFSILTYYRKVEPHYRSIWDGANFDDLSSDLL